jgi:hypothetical protein
MEPLQIITVISAILISLIGIYVAYGTNILRESNGDTSPFSLSKFQLWLWTVVICPIFTLHWGFHFLKDPKPTINDTSLILLGIAGGVTLTSGIITQVNKNKQAKMKSSGLTVPPLKVDKTSQGFWIDLLIGDDQNMPVERLQNLLFTFIYVIIYISFFFSKMETPGTEVLESMNYINFSQNAYILMGISSGSYLIGKGMNR